MYTDISDVLLQAGLITSAIVVYLIFFRKTSNKKGYYRVTGWNHPLKTIVARYAVNRWKSKLKINPLYDTPRPNQTEGFDAFTIRATAPDGSAVDLSIKKLCGLKPLVEVHLFIKLQDGSSYILPYDSKTSTTSWENFTHGWKAGDLKVQILEHKDRYRILFNGLLLRKDDGAIHHVKLNLIWTSASRHVRHPEDWSNELAAETLALEPWRDGAWHDLLSKCGEGAGSWLQFGAVQGRLQAFDESGKLARSEYLRTRGVKERNWAPTYKRLRRSVNITVAAKDGTVVNLQGLSYKNNFTQCIFGSVRMPDFSVQYITSTDFEMSDFCETADELPKTYTINVNAGKRCLKVVLRISNDGSHLISGMLQEYESVHRLVFAEINGECGSGILELGYERKDKLTSPLSPKFERYLKWLDLQSIKNAVKYCLDFEDPSAACVEFVGGKGASLALLSSIQTEEGFQVPPGFCITTKALDKYLEMNAKVKVAIKDIETAGVDYQETVFKDKCDKAVELFLSQELSGELKDDILQSLAMLRAKALKKYPGSEIRYAVRSSAVGEDSEALSAAGQNETVLGISSNDDVLRSVLKCWASMFAFTSAYYRRQNGQPCMCGGALVVQVLAEARVAGVMFTRHPEAGDPSRIVITANYGLGESVVSGSVEPDTIIVKRNINGKLSIANIQLGSKSQRIVTQDDGVGREDVPESDRNTACLFDDDILRLAKIGVEQDQLWRAGRDIEFAISKKGIIYLLQARPITSLEAWSEEELLHELDFPVMSDDELITFANTGEVLPKPFTALTYDIVIKPMDQGISKVTSSKSDGYDGIVVVTHNRGAISLYNSVYRRVPKTIDINLRMLEISIHGHKVADDSILSTALHRRQPSSTDKLVSIFEMIKNLFVVKRRMKETVTGVTNMKINIESLDVLEMCNNVKELDKVVLKYFMNHASTSMASTFTQFIAMSVLLEGKSDFTPEQCNEISVMLNSGDVLSAEVPQGLATLAQMLEDSGRVEEFKKEDPKAAMDWLKVNLPSVFEEVTKFLDQHGHRAIMEFELSTKPWVLVPEDLMKVLMQVVPSKDTMKARSSDEVIASLKTPQKPNTRKALRWILPLCQRTVRYRESTKAHLILAIHKIRLAIIQLGHRMVKDWYLPRYDLVFYFRAHELKTFIETRDPALLKKAIQRQNYNSNWGKLKFAEMNKGWVEPLKTQGPRISSDGDVKVAGTSVCGGEIVARACVVRDLAEIDQLRQGDILITHATDIGWSPYFPLLSGIVTELGGLISHGAVIAREYGLPCIVGAVDATNIFTTGDNVRLSGNTGVVEKVNIENTEES